MKRLTIILTSAAIGLLAVCAGDVITLEGSPAYAAYLTIQTNAPNYTIPIPNTSGTGTETNGVVVIQSTNATNNFPAGFVDSLSPEGRTNLVQYLVKGGHICAVFGHNFRGGRPGEVNQIFLDWHPDVSYRTCEICGLLQSRTMREWK